MKELAASQTTIKGWKHIAMVYDPLVIPLQIMLQGRD
jgi:hypothetical protein